MFYRPKGTHRKYLGSRKNKEVVGDKRREKRKVKVFKKVGQISKGVLFGKAFIQVNHIESNVVPGSVPGPEDT